MSPNQDIKHLESEAKYLREKNRQLGSAISSALLKLTPWAVMETSMPAGDLLVMQVANPSLSHWKLSHKERDSISEAIRTLKLAVYPRSQEDLALEKGKAR